jgi:hypothetical protein
LIFNLPIWQVFTMKLKSLTTAVPLLTLISSLLACGGGGDQNAGASTALSTSPTEFTISSPSPSCSSGYAGEFFVYGGAAPYRLDNPGPNLISLYKKIVDDKGQERLIPTTVVDAPGGSFHIVYLGGCFDPITLVVVDKLNKQTKITLKNVYKKEDAATTP